MTKQIPRRVAGDQFSERAVAHATGGAQCRQEGCERGYYHLHRQLNDPLLLHTLISFSSTTNYTNFSNYSVAGIAQPIIRVIRAIRGL
jgi:hypothetical protein